MDLPKYENKEPQTPERTIILHTLGVYRVEGFGFMADDGLGVEGMLGRDVKMCLDCCRL